MKQIAPLPGKHACVFALLFILPAFIHAQIITTVAGGSLGEGKTATSIGVVETVQIATDSAENIYVLDRVNNLVRKIDAHTGIVHTIAGGGTTVPGNGIPALAAGMISPGAITVDKAGNIYVASAPGVISRIDAVTGIMTTFVGGGAGDDGGLAAKARLSGSVTSMAVDKAGDLYICDVYRIRKVTLATGIITRIAGSATSVTGYSGDGGPATSATISYPRGIVVDLAGNVYFADNNNNVIRKIDAATGIITTVAGKGLPTGFGGDGGPALNATLSYPWSVSVDTTGNLYLCDNNRVRKITTATGVINTIAGTGTVGYTGDGGPASLATFSNIQYVYRSMNGNFYVADNLAHVVRKIDAAGMISTVYGNGSSGTAGIGGPAKDAQLNGPQFIALDKNGNIYLNDNSNNLVYRVDAATQVISQVAAPGIVTPTGLATDTSGNLYIVDGGICIRKVTMATGIVTRVAGSATVAGGTGDGGPAINATLNAVRGIAVDKYGNIYIADFNNSRIRKVTAATGIITTIAGSGIFGYAGDGGPATAARLSQPTGIAVDSKGNVYWAESNNSVIRRLDAATGIISTVAGTGTPAYSGDNGLATAAALRYPYGVVTDSLDNVYITDQGNHRLRKLDITTGIISTIAGTGQSIYNGDSILASSAALNNPVGIAFDTRGNIFVAELIGYRIRKIGAGAPVPYSALLTGTVFYDDNANGIKDASEPWADGMTITADKTGARLSTMTKDGLFKMKLDMGTYKLGIASPASYTASPAVKYTVFTAQNKTDTVQFALQPSLAANDLRIGLAPLTPARPGAKLAYRLTYANTGTTGYDSIRILFVKNHRMALGAVTPFYTSRSADTLVWRFLAVKPHQSGVIDINGTLDVPPAANNGDRLYTTTFVDPFVGDATPADDTIRLVQQVTGSFDPNDKSESHGNAVSPAQVAAGEYLYYLVRFQNTGTDTAFTVVVKDTLDTKLDWNSLETLATSHPYLLSVAGGKLAWQLNDILLPDSNTNEPASHGYIAFRIRPLATVSVGDTIRSASAIYFDYNLPVQTNTVYTAVRLLPPPPPVPVLQSLANSYCSNAAPQWVRIANLPVAGTTVQVRLGNNLLPVRSDSLFGINPRQLAPGKDTIWIEYTNETGEAFGAYPLVLAQPVSPVVGISADKQQLTSLTESVTVTASNMAGGGTHPVYSFAADRAFTHLLQAESTVASVTIAAPSLANGDNWIYAGMKTSDSCYTAQRSVDSVKITRNSTATAIVDVDNPRLVINAWPNPFVNELTLSGFSPAKTYQVCIFNSVGSLVYRQTLSGRQSVSVNTSAWSNGLYRLCMYDVKKNTLMGSLPVIRQ